MGEWIKCSERMPEPGQPVLVVSSMGGVVEKHVYDWDGMTWCDFYEEHAECRLEVFSHWMPLPEPPEA